MGDVIAFPTATRHVAVERVARELYNRVNADLESLPEVILNRCYRTYVRATDAGVPEDVAEHQAEELRVALHKWCEAVHEVELWGEGVDRERSRHYPDPASSRCHSRRAHGCSASRRAFIRRLRREAELWCGTDPMFSRTGCRDLGEIFRWPPQREDTSATDNRPRRRTGQNV